MKRDLADVYDEYVWDIYGFLAYRVGSRADAEDLTQATFERAVKAWGRFDPERASPKTWLFAIANNLLIDHYRSRGADKSVLVTNGDPTGLSDAQVQETGPEMSGISDQLVAALEALSERDRHVVALRFGGDLTGAEIARTTGLTLASVQQILSRSMRKLRVHLEASEN